MTRTADTPLSLMRMALALLDRTGEGTSDAATHLRAAIDARNAAPATPNRDELAQAGE